MNAVEQREKLTHLRDQVGEIEAAVHALFMETADGSRLEGTLQAAKAALMSASGALGLARDAIEPDGRYE